MSAPTNSPRTSRIVEARRSRYGSTQQTSPNSSSTSLLKNLSREALLHIPLSQLSNEEALLDHSTSSSTSCSSSSTSSSISSSPSPTNNSALSTETSSSDLQGVLPPAAASPSFVRVTRGGTWGSSNGNGSPSSQHKQREFTEEEKTEIYSAIINSEVETLPHLCSLLQVKFVSFIPLPANKRNRTTTWLHLAASECTKDSKKLFDYLLNTKKEKRNDKSSNDTLDDECGDNSSHYYYRVNDKNANGWTPLHEAAHAGNFDAVVSLLSHGADVSIDNSDSALPLHYFVKHDFSNEKGCSEDMYTLYNTVETLLGEGGKLINHTDSRKATALHYACMAKQEEFVRLLIRNNAKLDVLDKNEQTPLHYAIMARASTLIKMLVDAGADISNLPTPASSPLQIAKEVPEILLILQPSKVPSRAATFSNAFGATSGDASRQQRIIRTGSHTLLPSPFSSPVSSQKSGSVVANSKASELKASGGINDTGSTATPRKPPRPVSKRDGSCDQASESSMQSSPSSSPQQTRTETKRRPVSIVHRLPPDLSKE
eukprot:TRINITY_DN142_c0_g1_i2.p1 TRINITY_DN142_c0_g1~~TRINITY_DN142_c0_g1_i2.p1  ORF type:complete len:543 (+),score=125.45 TRINITY_DN142_c0_g1_i2:281-1909(+)